MKKLTVRELVLCAVFAALTAVCSQIQIPIPMVPINLALLAVLLCGGLLRPVAAVLAMVVYVVMGLCGLPVFSGLAGGAAVLFGKTGGYIIGYVLAAWLTSLLSRAWKLEGWQLAPVMALSVAACYAFGTAWFMVVTGMSLLLSLTYCVLPFLLGDCLKIALATFLTARLHKPLLQVLQA